MEQVTKPWGHEQIWARTNAYAGKLLHIRAGHMLSLQYHDVKEETVYVLEGRLHLHTTSAPTSPVKIDVLEQGQSFHIPPKLIHRVEAKEDVVLIEVSTSELDDVVRLEDNYGRAGS